MQPWFDAPGYPLSLPDYWDSIFGFAISQGIAPVWMGEFGSVFPTTNTSAMLIKETQWLQQIQRYLRYVCCSALDCLYYRLAL